MVTSGPTPERRKTAKLNSCVELGGTASMKFNPPSGRAPFAPAKLLVAALAAVLAVGISACAASQPDSIDDIASGPAWPALPIIFEHARDVNLENAVVTVEDQTFTGFELTPAPTVVLDGFTLTEGKDYTLAYEDNVEIGTATVTIGAAGDFKGSASANFTIEPHPEGWDNVSGHTLYYTAESTIATNTTVPGTDGNLYYVDENGTPLKNAWVELAGVRYYCGENGVLATGLQTIDGDAYIFNDDGALRYISGNERLDRIVCRIVRDRTGFNVSEAYDYVAFDFAYVSMDVDRSYAGWMVDYALRLYDEGSGNCYGFSALFHYIMRAIGYETTVIDGYVRDRTYGNTIYEHCWVEMTVGGTAFALDPVFDNPRWNQPSFFVTYAENSSSSARFEYVL